MSERGTPKDAAIEDPALETEHDDTTGTGDEGIDEGGDSDVVDDDAEPVEDDAGAETGEEPDDAGIDGDGRRAAQVRQPSRAQRRIETLAREAKAAREEAAAARREAAEFRAQMEGRRTQEQQQLERERVALMTPEEKLDYYRAEDQKALERRFAQLEFRSQDAADRSNFGALCARNPAYQAVADEVESQLAEARRIGTNLPRETIATYLIGKRAIERVNRAKPKQARAGAERIARETVRAPGSGASNVRAGQERSSGAAARNKRLENMDI